MPKNLAVEVQDPNEEILLLTRRHILTNLGWVAVVIAMLLAPLLFGYFPMVELLPDRFQIMTVVLWYLVTLAITLEGFFNWYFDVFIVTDERIIDVDFKNLIYKNITTAKIDRIEDVTHSVSGAIPSFFNFGNVMIQTAGAVVKMSPQETTPFLEIWNTPNPGKISKLINELILEEEREKIEGRVR